ncbi:MAG: hypothetical protein JNM52_10595 [Betaproteobacteria bacterium]|nr:hypothetical protein [Betaproteobacteria bacterium]
MNTIINNPAFNAAFNTTSEVALAALTPLETGLVSGGGNPVGWLVEPVGNPPTLADLTPLETGLVSGGETVYWLIETTGSPPTP